MYTKLDYQKHGLFVHAYADDTQLYIPFDLNNPNDEMSARKQAEACILEIKSWMSMNKLKLNDEKTEFLIMTSKYQQHKIQDHSINIGTTTIHASKSARNLGIVFDDNLCMDQHVKCVCHGFTGVGFPSYKPLPTISCQPRLPSIQNGERWQSPNVAFLHISTSQIRSLCCKEEGSQEAYEEEAQGKEETAEKTFEGKKKQILKVHMNSDTSETNCDHPPQTASKVSKKSSNKNQFT